MHKEKKIFFSGFTKIRAVAALMVLFHHIELYKHRDGMPSLFDNFWEHFIAGLGKNGVHIFFVLSGFLITYLLLVEKKKYQSINIRMFYFRRLLRIWPLYYCVVLLSFFMIPFMADYFEILQKETHYYNRVILLKKDSWSTLGLFLLFLPNLALKLKPAVVGAAQSWSVGVEEQFYLIWPHVINKVNGKRTLFFVLCSFVMVAFIPRFICIFNANIGGHIQYLVDLIPIHFMAIGAIGAFFLFFYRTQVEIILNNKFLFIVNTFLVILCLFVPYSFIGFKVLFGFLALFQLMFITTIKAANNVAGDVLEFVGSISYGVYMYHPFIMYICFAIFNNLFSIEEYWLYNTGLYSSIFSLTIGLSYLSYYFFESKFIKLKKEKFTLIGSGR
jgi:peptidoglycan/LPS O-acetylase OafA/YrhL|tara:strand:+ start:214 stop:1374 length:1161 start_codon:yes stop_codon:yes gene_type:complete